MVHPECLTCLTLVLDLLFGFPGGDKKESEPEACSGATDKLPSFSGPQLVNLLDKSLRQSLHGGLCGSTVPRV